MAVKKSNKSADLEAKVEVEVPVETVETKVDTVEVAEEKHEVETPHLEVDESKAKVNKAPSGTSKIRMRVDHKCTVAMVKYDLEKGKTYVVPDNVKRILNKAGLLAPLN